MILIIGLGNPGPKYKNTRHNVGFMAVDEFTRKNNFPEFKLSKKFYAEISEKILDEEKVLLAKPQTFMNESGKAVKVLSIKYQVSSIIVIHDDIDLPVGKIKIVEERGSAGHKGVESIIKNIGNDGLIRIRIGISHLPLCTYTPMHRNTKAKKIVLKNFSKEEQKIMGKVLQRTVGALDLFIEKGLEKTMNEYNK